MCHEAGHGLECVATPYSQCKGERGTYAEPRTPALVPRIADTDTFNGSSADAPEAWVGAANRVMERSRHDSPLRPMAVDAATVRRPGRLYLASRWWIRACDFFLEHLSYVFACRLFFRHPPAQYRIGSQYCVPSDAGWVPGPLA